MRLLLLNTCGAEGMVALAEEETVVATEILPGRGSSEELLPAMRRLFASAGWSPGAIEGVVVVHGPGSFTGVRVGLSAAKGLCDALAVPMIALSRLELVAACAGAVEVLALLDAGRSEFYCGIYTGGECVREELLPRDVVLQLAGGRAAITCEPRVVDALAEIPMALVDEPGADLVLRLALQRIAGGSWTDVAAIDANYLRRTDAELLVERRSSQDRA